MNKETFLKYIQDKISRSEFETLQKDLHDASFESDLVNWSKEQWDANAAEESRISDLKETEILQRIHAQLDIKAAPAAATRTIPAFGEIVNTLAKLAAAVLLPLFLYYFINHQNQTAVIAEYTKILSDTVELSTPVGSRTEVLLSDGTIVYMNADSKIAYPAMFGKGSRNVKLTGEAYFEVAHNPEKPFIVQVENLKVKAVGTAFNIRAYSNTPFIQTTLVNGKVILEKRADNGQEKVLGTMVPNQQVIFNTENSEMTSQIVNVINFISWKDGKLVFREASIVDITDKLAHLYNAEFEFLNDMAKDFTYTATLIDLSLVEILDLLKLATPIDYKAVPGKELPDGSKTRQKILIYTKY